METPAFAFIASNLRGRLLVLARQLLSRDEAEDAVQDALVRLWYVWAQLPSAADAERLGVRLTKNACIDRLRSSHTRHSVPLPAEEAVAIHSVSNAEDELQERELRNALQAAANCLPRRERELWQLHAEDGMSVSEIAATTGIGPRSVSVMLSSARARIRKQLKKGGYFA